MEDPGAKLERADLISRLFALLTARLEDAAGLAAECQGSRPTTDLLERARELVTLSEEVVTLSAAALALLERSD